MPFNVGETVGPYQVIEQLGQGGMATVFKAYDASHDRYVALKVLHPAFKNMIYDFEKAWTEVKGEGLRSASGGSG